MKTRVYSELEVLDILDRYDQLSKSYITLQRNPSLDNVGEFILRNMAFQQVKPKGIELKAVKLD